MYSDPNSRADATPSANPPANLPGDAGFASTAARVWAQYQDVIFERMAAIETAVEALRHGELTDEIRQAALLEAHRLAGSLGMFGLADGTDFARRIEHIFDEPPSTAPETSQKLGELAAALRRVLEKGLG